MYLVWNLPHRYYRQLRISSDVRTLLLVPYKQSTADCSPSISAPQWNEGTPKIVVHIPRNPLSVTTTKQRGSWLHTEIMPVLPIARKKYPAVFRSIFGILCCISGIYLFIPRFFAEPGLGIPGVSTIKSSDISFAWSAVLHWSCLKAVSTCYNAFGTFFPSGCL